MFRIIWNRLLGLGLLSLLLGCSQTIPAQQCSSDADCTLGRESCVEGRCKAFKSCVSDQGCAWPKSQCIGQLCLPSATCQTRETCPHPEHQCVQGYCSLEPMREVASALYVKFGNTKPSDGERDFSPNSQTGVWEGQGRSIEGGYIGRAGAFNGKDALLKLPSHSSLAKPHITVEAWVKPTATQQAMIFQFCGDDCKNGYAMSINTQGQLQFQVADTKTTGSCQSNTKIPTGTWTHLAGSYDGKSIRCFVNGKVDGDTAWSGQMAYDVQAVWIGGQSDTTQMFSGLIDEVAVLPWGRSRSFSPGLNRYLYVAGTDGKIHVLDGVRDQVLPDQSFPAPDGGVPVALGNNGQTLYLWSQSKKSLLAFDVATKKVLVALPVPDGGMSDGALASLDESSQTLWLWGPTTHVFALPLTGTSQPKASFSELGSSVGAGIAWDGKQQKFLLSDTEGKQLHQLSAQTLKKLPSLRLEDVKSASQKPAAIAINPVTHVLYVASQEESEVYLFGPKDGNSYDLLGTFLIKETEPNGNTGKPRKISRMFAHSLGEYLFYTFVKPGYIYRLDIKAKTQHLIRGKGVGAPIDLMTSSYQMHLEQQGHKFFVQHENTGIFHVVGVQERQLLQTIQLKQQTVPGRFAIVGVTHPTQPF